MMKTSVRIALIGDHNPEVTAHIAIPKALELSADALSCGVEATWMATDALEPDVTLQLSTFDALWCVPASPYVSIDRKSVV